MEENYEVQRCENYINVSSPSLKMMIEFGKNQGFKLLNCETSVETYIVWDENGKLRCRRFEFYRNEEITLEYYPSGFLREYWRSPNCQKIKTGIYQRFEDLSANDNSLKELLDASSFKSLSFVEMINSDLVQKIPYNSHDRSESQTNQTNKKCFWCRTNDAEIKLWCNHEVLCKECFCHHHDNGWVKCPICYQSSRC